MAVMNFDHIKTTEQQDFLWPQVRDISHIIMTDSYGLKFITIFFLFNKEDSKFTYRDNIQKTHKINMLLVLLPPTPHTKKNCRSLDLRP